MTRLDRTDSATPPVETPSVDTPPFYDVEQQRTILLSALAVVVGAAAVLVARILLAAIALITNLVFHGRWAASGATPLGNHLGLLVIIVPVLGGLVVGLMARFGSGAIRGHGIPEAMEQILVNESRISPRVTVLKPLSAAIAIGTGGPFGAEGPIIATGGALGSLVGQVLHTTADERKTLLAAGAAAGMSAIFGTPVAAVLLAIELLLFEYRPRSIVPVAFAAATATALRLTYEPATGIFQMPPLAPPSALAMVAYVVIGALVGFVSVWVTRALYMIEEGFERLPVHFMWWPAIGAVAVGVIGYFEPRTLGVGYYNIQDILTGRLLDTVLLTLVILKFISWAIALGSGTSGGTLAPLFTIGGGFGALLGVAAVRLIPGADVDPRIAALVGMAAIFAGASRALLTSVVFAFETTRQPMGLLPLLAGCTAAFTISSLMMRYTIMTEKLAKRGTYVPSEYVAVRPEDLARRDAEAERAQGFAIGRRAREKRAEQQVARETELL